MALSSFTSKEGNQRSGRLFSRAGCMQLEFNVEYFCPCEPSCAAVLGGAVIGGDMHNRYRSRKLFDRQVRCVDRGKGLLLKVCYSRGAPHRRGACGTRR